MPFIIIEFLSGIQCLWSFAWEWRSWNVNANLNRLTKPLLSMRKILNFFVALNLMLTMWQIRLNGFFFFFFWVEMITTIEKAEVWCRSFWILHKNISFNKKFKLLANFVSSVFHKNHFKTKSWDYKMAFTHKRSWYTTQKTKFSQLVW